MDSVLEGAIVLSVCKLACSLPFLRSVVTSTSSPVSFCCHCLLVFTDVILTAFFSCLHILERWQTVAPSTGDEIALRFLLLFCHIYGMVFLLWLPQIIVDTQVRHLQQGTNEHQNMKQKSPNESEKPNLRYNIVAFLGCLSLWIFGTLNIRLRWKLEEVSTAVCLYSTKSLLTCLPNIYSPMMRVLPPCWAMALLYISIAIAICLCLLHIKKTSSSQEVDINVCANRDDGLSPEYTEKQHKDYNSTEKAIHFTLSEEREPARPQSGSSLGAEVMIGVVCVLATFVFPLHLTVNIHLISAVEKIAERSVKYFALSRRNHMDMI